MTARFQDFNARETLVVAFDEGPHVQRPCSSIGPYHRRRLHTRPIFPGYASLRP